MTWLVNEEKLLCIMVLKDSLGPVLSERVKEGTAFWRAFIVQDRKTGEIKAKFRFKYDKDDSSWTYITSRKPIVTQEGALEYLRSGLHKMLIMTTKALYPDVDMTDAVMSYFPPDDNGDGTNTVNWLIEKDLIHNPRPLENNDDYGPH